MTTYHGQRANANAANRSTQHEHLVVDSSRLKNSADIEDDYYNRERALSGDLIGKPRHEDATDESAEFKHTCHESLAETALSLWEHAVEFAHDIDNRDHSLVVTKGETAHGRNEGSEEYIRGLQYALHAGRPI